jgi:indole-3-glycerol phosphate synthase
VSLLARILESKREELGRLRAIPLPEPGYTRPPPPFAEALRRPPGAPLRILAEVKFRSPSAGPLSRALDAPARAAAYVGAGAAAVSVLCDGPFFDGSWRDVAHARARLDAEASRAPVLAKEFVLDERQIAIARRCGASALLIIARIVSPDRLAALVAATLEAGLEPLVEVADEAELAAALGTEARVIGVNSRDLDTLAMDAERAAGVLAQIPGDRVAVHLSGLKTPPDAKLVAQGRADAALIGEALMREDDPEPLLRSMVRASGAALSA